MRGMIRTGGYGALGSAQMPCQARLDDETKSGGRN